MHVNTGYQRDALPVVRHHVEVFEPYDVVVAPSGSCVGSVRHQHAAVARRAGDEALAVRAEAVAAADVRAVRAARRRARRRGRRRPLPAPGDLPPDLPLAAAAAGRRPAAAPAAGGARDRAGRAAAAESCCGFGGTFALKNADTSTAMLAGQDAARARHRRRGLHGRATPPASCTSAAGCPGCAPACGPCTWPRSSPRPTRRPRARPRGRRPDPGRGGPVTRTGQPTGRPTFLGLPAVHAPAGVGALQGDQGFPTAARRALGDAQLRGNIGRATTTIREKRARVVAEVPDWEELRAAGSAIKAATMARLPDLLEQLEEQVTARGGVVHWARDAAEANADRHRAGPGDRRARGRQGQVDGHAGDRAERGAGGRRHRGLGDRPRRAHRAARPRPPVAHPGPGDPPQPREIREIFRREMPGLGAGRPHRRPAPRWRWPRGAHLRRSSCAAEVAVSGANFAVAETGTLAVVESEGNGRMCLTLPRTLITVMGIEKLVPTWRDLEVFLQLLPRSSTGERMNPYTSMWTGVTPGRRAAGVPPGAARQRPHGGAGRPGRPRGAALHPLLGLPERLPGLRAHRRPRVRLGLPRPDRRGAVAAADRRHGRRRQRHAALRLLAVRCLLRRLPGARSTSRRCWCTCGRSTSERPGRTGGPSARRRSRWRRRPGRWLARRACASPQRAARLGRLLAGPARRRAPDHRAAAAAVAAGPAPATCPCRRGRRSASGGRAGARRDATPRHGGAGAGSARALGTGPVAPAAVPRAYRTAGEHAAGRPSRCSTLLVERLEDYQAAVRAVHRRASCRRVARGAARPAGAGRPRWSCRPACRRRGPAGARRARDAPGGAAAAELDAVAGSSRRCAVAIAETGTIVLDAGAGPGPPRADPGARPARVRRAGRPGRRRPCPRRWPGSTRAAADLDQRPVRDQRHRAATGRGRARPAHARRRARGRRGSR